MEESWARPFVLDALSLGLMTARPNHTFAATATVSIREFARVIRRSASLLGDDLDAQTSLLLGENRRYVSGAVAVETVSRLADAAVRSVLPDERQRRRPCGPCGLSFSCSLR